MTRKVQLVNNEYYHVFNRGVDKRVVFQDKYDFERFFQGMQEFNVTDPIGSIHQNSFRKNKNQLSSPAAKSDKLVNFVCYCLNPNHYHFILQQLADKGIEKFMHKLGTGYVHYFNKKNNRSGCLFQGAFKAQHINSNEYLLHASAYVNLNNRVHQLSSPAAKSSWDEYLGKEGGICCRDSVTKQFNNVLEYKRFSENQLKYIKENKKISKLVGLDLLSSPAAK